MLERLFETPVLLFTLPALLGTAVFLVKLGMMAVGFAGEGDVDAGGVDVPDVDVDIDFDGDADMMDAGHVDSTDAFKLLSVQAIAAFLMGFGWGGVGCLLGFGWELSTSLLIATLIGIALMWAIAWVMQVVYGLEGSGNVSIRSAVGREGDVYLTVPESHGGKGRVRLTIDGRDRMYNAVTEGEELPTRTRIKVVKVNTDNSVTVTRA